MPIDPSERKGQSHSSAGKEPSAREYLESFMNPPPTENKSEFTIGRMTWHKATWDDGYEAGLRHAARLVPLILAVGVLAAGLLVVLVMVGHDLGILWPHP